MKIIEKFVESKYGPKVIGEDIVFQSDDFIAIIDGATDKSGVKLNNLSPGLFASKSIYNSLSTLNKDIDMQSAISILSKNLNSDIIHQSNKQNLDLTIAPCASIAIYSKHKKQIWRVGDVKWMALINGKYISNEYEKKVDMITSSARSFFIKSSLLSGKSVDDFLLNDSGRDFIHPLLSSQHLFQNIDDELEGFGYGVIDGQDVPLVYQECFDMGNASEIILSSDGYPKIFPSLKKSEDYLFNDLLLDPLRINNHPSTKAIMKNQVSFDDRSYIRFSTN